MVIYTIDIRNRPLLSNQKFQLGLKPGYLGKGSTLHHYVKSVLNFKE